MHSPLLPGPDPRLQCEPQEPAQPLISLSSAKSTHLESNRGEPGARATAVVRLPRRSRSRLAPESNAFEPSPPRLPVELHVADQARVLVLLQRAAVALQPLRGPTAPRSRPAPAPAAPGRGGRSRLPRTRCSSGTAARRARSARRWPVAASGRVPRTGRSTAAARRRQHGATLYDVSVRSSSRRTSAIACVTWYSDSFSPVRLAKCDPLLRNSSSGVRLWKPVHAHQVVDVVAVQAVGRRRQDEVAARPRRSSWAASTVGLRAVDLGLGDELEVVRGHVEDAGRRAVGEAGWSCGPRWRSGPRRAPGVSPK